MDIGAALLASRVRVSIVCVSCTMGNKGRLQVMLKYPPLCPSRNFACDDLGALPPTTGCPRSTPPNVKRDIAGSTSSDCGRTPPSLALDPIMWGTLGLGGAPSCEVWGGSLCTAAVNVRRARFGRRGVRAIRDVSGCMLWARWARTNMEGKNGIVHSLGDSPARPCPVCVQCGWGALAPNY